MIIGTFSGPPAPYGGSASANEYNTIQELLYKLPDNTANLIQAKDVRDSVYTLWERISDVQTVASQSASASAIYTNSNPTIVTIGGITAGSTFNNQTMKQMWDSLLYPYVAPTTSLSPNIIREFGSTNQITLSWTVTKKSDTINSIIISGSNGYTYPVPGAPFNTFQASTITTNATQNVDTTFTITADDGTNSVSSNVTFSWRNAVYWGRTSTFTAPSMSIGPISTTQPDWADGAGISPGKMLATTLNATYSNIDGAGQYLVFAWPTSFGTPTFIVNGMYSTAFTKILSSTSFTNMNMYIEDYDVWISNTAQNSPITSLVIS